MNEVKIVLKSDGQVSPVVRVIEGGYEIRDFSSVRIIQEGDVAVIDVEAKSSGFKYVGGEVRTIEEVNEAARRIYDESNFPKRTEYSLTGLSKEMAESVGWLLMAVDALPPCTVNSPGYIIVPMYRGMEFKFTKHELPEGKFVWLSPIKTMHEGNQKNYIHYPEGSE